MPDEPLKGQLLANPVTKPIMSPDSVETPPEGYFAEFYNSELQGYPVCRKDHTGNVAPITARSWDIEVDTFEILDRDYPFGNNLGVYAYVRETTGVIGFRKKKGFYLATPTEWAYKGVALDDGSIGLNPVDETGLVNKSVPVFDLASQSWKVNGKVVASWQETPADSDIPSEKLVKDTFDNLSLSGFVYITEVTANAGGKTTYDKVYLAGTTPPNKVLLSCKTDTTSLRVSFECEGGENFTPIISIGETQCSNLTQLSNTRRYTGSIDITVEGTGDIEVVSDTKQTATVGVEYVAAPEIQSVVFTSLYPNGQTELKADDVMSIKIITDVDVKYVEVDNFEACKAGNVTVTEGKDIDVDVVIANRGNTATARPVKVRVKTVTGSYSEWVTSTGTVLCNNLHPSFAFNTITYPGNQQALKDSETADVSVTVMDYDIVAYSSINNEVSIPSPSSYSQVKTVTRISGNYNIITHNYQITATRSANNAQASYTCNIKIANVAPIVTVATPSSRLRSGGNDGTSAQNYTVTISANQSLLSAPSLAAGIGTWQGGGFSGSGTSWTRSLQIHDNDNKGSATFSGLSAAGLSGIQQTVISSGASYVVGGFVSRSLTLVAFGTQTEMNVAVKDTTKLSMSWSVKYPMYYSTIGTQPPVSSGWTINATEANPTTVIILDTQAAGGSSQASTITIEETV